MLYNLMNSIEKILIKIKKKYQNKIIGLKKMNVLINCFNQRNLIIRRKK